MIDGVDGVHTVRAHGAVAAIMQEDIRSAAAITVRKNPSVQPRQDTVSPNRIPVVAGDVPHHRRQAEIAGYPKNNGTPATERRAEKTYSLSGEVFEHS